MRTTTLRLSGTNDSSTRTIDFKTKISIPWDTSVREVKTVSEVAHRLEDNFDGASTGDKVSLPRVIEFIKGAHAEWAEEQS